MAAISRLKPDQVVYSVVRRKMGNTKIMKGDLFTVKIFEVNIEEGWVIASHNGNPRQKYWEGSFKNWKVKKPEPKCQVMGMNSY